MAEKTRRVLPVGLPGGMIKHAGSGAPIEGWIRRGGDFHAVPPATYRMWRASAVGPAPGELLARAQELGVSDPTAVYSELTGEDLLVVLPADPVGRRAVFASHRLHLLMPGIGSVENGLLAMGHDPEAPWVRVDPLTYGILLASNDGRSIWEVAEDAAESAGASVEEVAAAFAGPLARLLAAGMIALDMR